MEKIEEIKAENNDLAKAEIKLETSNEKAKKERKPFEWTDKRLEAFKKMREGLETKNVIAKELKAEKKKSEKDEIKKRIREIMSSSSKELKVKPSSADSSDESNSEAEEPKKTSKKAVATEERPKKASKKSKRAVVEVQDESSSEEEASSESESEEERVVMSNKQHERLKAQKQNKGKTSRTAVLFNPMDQFILL